mgnify:CR=1 FL=1
MSGDTVARLLQGVLHLTPGAVFMLGIGLLLVYLAVAKEYEPMLLLPIGAGCLFANLPLSPMIAEDGALSVLYRMGIENEMFPLLIFVGIPPAVAAAVKAGE